MSPHTTARGTRALPANANDPESLQQGKQLLFCPAFPFRVKTGGSLLTATNRKLCRELHIL